MNRRQLLQYGFTGLLLSRFENWSWAQAEREPSPALSNARRLGSVSFSDEAQIPMGTAFGDELDGRLYTDLSALSPESPLPSSDHFYVRTRASQLLRREDVDTIAVNGLVEQPSVLNSETLIRNSKSMGAHLMECAGNARTIHFGLMSAAEWSGVPIADAMEHARTKPDATRVLVSGFDNYLHASRS